MTNNRITPEQVQSMSKEELRIALAEALGWTQVRWHYERGDEGTSFRWLRGRKPDGPHDGDEVPDWPMDWRDAGVLCEELAERGKGTLMISYRNDEAQWACVMWRETIGSTGATAPEAIARLYLLTKANTEGATHDSE